MGARFAGIPPDRPQFSEIASYLGRCGGIPWGFYTIDYRSANTKFRPMSPINWRFRWISFGRGAL